METAAELFDLLAEDVARSLPQIKARHRRLADTPGQRKQSKQGHLRWKL